MLTVALVLGAVALGAAGTPHCAAMCAAPCAAATGGGDRWRLTAFHASRVLGYAAAGAVAAASVDALGTLAQAQAALRPMWTLLHVAMLALGVWLVARGRQPAWMEGLGRGAAACTKKVRAAPITTMGGAAPVFFHAGAGSSAARPSGRIAASAAAGALWVAWPCGLLQSALLLAALADDSPGGALVMTSFAGTSAAGLVLGPVAWRRWLGGAGSAADAWGIRLAGAMLVLAGGWSLAHGLAEQAAVWCRP